MKYKAVKKLYLCIYKKSNCLRREIYLNRFYQWLDDNIYGIKGFKKLFNSIKYFIKQKKNLYLHYNEKHYNVLTCTVKVISTAEKPILEIRIFSEFYFNKEDYYFGDELYCKDIKSVVLEFIKGTVMPEYFVDTPEDKKRLYESGDNYGDVWDEIIDARVEKIKADGKWDDSPCDRRYAAKWHKTYFFMPYARNKNQRRRIVVREVGPVYPEGAIKLEDYYKDHKDSRPKLVF
jgi:hypothetical protein